jgi:hypothetical protein
MVEAAGPGVKKAVAGRRRRGRRRRRSCRDGMAPACVGYVLGRIQSGDGHVRG